MKSVTSFFNVSVLRKDILRFSPIWSIYSVFLLLTVSATAAAGGGGLLMLFRLEEMLPYMAIVNLIYAALSAMTLFGDMYDSRMCYALHAMPLRREGWFLTHCTAGMLFSLLPDTAVCLVLGVALGQYWYLAAAIWCVCILQYLFFFGVAVFSAMCVGTRFAMVVIYAIINSFSMIFMWLARVFYQPILYGIQLRDGMFRLFCPVMQMSTDSYLRLQLSAPANGVFQGLEGRSWQYLLVCALIGILMGVFALLIYRRRALETAGNFIALRPLAPVFMGIYTLAIAAVMYAVSSMFFPEQAYVFLAAGVLLGFLSGQMLLSKTVRVFRLRVLLGFVAMMTVFGITIGLLWLDPVGVISYVPKLTNVESVEISTSNMIYFDEFQKEADSLLLDQKADVQTILDVHKLLIQQQDAQNQTGDFNLYMEYIMADGSEVWRNYPVSLDSQEGQILRNYFSSWQCVFKTDDWEAFAASVQQIDTTGGMQVPQEKMQQLLEALYLDCQAGNLAQTWSLYHYAPAQERLSITYQENGETRTLILRVYEFCSNTLQALASNE